MENENYDVDALIFASLAIIFGAVALLYIQEAMNLG
jgi:hypothetical protein